MVLPDTLPSALPPEPDPAPEASRRSRERRRWGVRAGVVGAALVVGVLLLGRVLGGGSYEFIATRGDYPVTWNHCQAIRFHVNPKGAPEGWQRAVREAVADIEAASGFVFMDLGTTTKTRLIGQRYDGNDWEPVLIVWSDRYQDSMLDGGVIGLGGSGTYPVDGIDRYVTGRISLDSSVRDPDHTRATLEHELGHVLGLDHTSDSSQLMYPEVGPGSRLGSGDRAGLRKLHDVPCSY